MKKDLKTDLLVNFFKGKKEIIFACLFGSEAKGRAGLLSDVDIAVYVDYLIVKKQKYPYGYRASLLTEIMRLLNRNDIDLVILNDASLFLAYQVMNFSRVLISKNDKLRLSFYCKTIDRYLDFKPMLKIHFEMLEKRIVPHG